MPGRPVPVLHRTYTPAIVEMSTVLNPNEKRLFRLVLELDRPRNSRPGGCFASVARLAKRLHMHRDTVTKTRRRLLKLGLVERSEAGVKQVRWFPALPRTVEIIPAVPIRHGRETEAWLDRQAVELDAALQRGPAPRLRSGAEIMADFDKHGAGKTPVTICLDKKDDSSGEGRRFVGDGKAICLLPEVQAVVDRLDKAVGQ